MRIRYLFFILIMGALILCMNIPKTSAKYVFVFDYEIEVICDIDKDPPIVSIVDINNASILNEEIATEYAIVTYNDTFSGVDTVVWRYNADEADFANSESNSFNSGTKFTNEGWYEVEVTDYAGNTTEYSFYIFKSIGEKG